ncbi:KGGVGR-motif variant AAA ATPase [Streptomyces sp. YIM 98790]|uniref:KGGVGR-motif variant AAA ATPase n=1 Tax=Streptomyces sp. YIM 98790 TaxID=2689077 RepID=UPI00140B6342|nr:AAA family ATPase [Streptomyces sp. YIM 98790]
MAEPIALEEPTPPEHLFTWVDVEEHLALLATARKWPGWLCAADGWWDGLELVVLPGTAAQDVQQWLDEAFGAGSTEWQNETLMLRLDDPRTTEFTGMPVVLSAAQDGLEQPPRVPLLREKHLTPQLAHALERPATEQFAHDVQLVAFHSFKGGVGRTVHAVAMADAMARRGARVLLIDADLEAPGITWMHRAQGGQLDFCFEDLLALLQGDEDGGWATAVEIAAKYLPNQRVGRYTGVGWVTVVPASRRPLLGPPRIDPADLLAPGRSPYFLTEALAALAVQTAADAVIIDLRAGATELSAPVLLDPRVQRIFVTTLSHQSLAGTERLLRQLGHRAPTLRGIDPASAVIITQYRQDAHEEQAERTREELGSALFASLREPDGKRATETGIAGSVDSDLLSRPLLSPFREELLALPSSWDAVLRVLESCHVAGVLEPIMPTASPAAAVAREPLSVADCTTLRGRLAETAGRLVYAEREGMASAGGFLVTDPLRRLLGDHRTEPPLALVVGAKGAGKTFMYAKACAARSWDEFTRASGIEGAQGPLPIVPVLESDNLEYDGLTTQDLRDVFAQSHGGRKVRADTSQELKDRLKSGLATLSPQDELGWRRLWLECLAAAAGVPVLGEGGAEAALTELGRRGAQAVFVIDGLEDLLQSIDDEPKRTALRVLLIDVLAWLRSLRGRPYGLVIFVRQDLVTRAVRQNSGQLLARYEPYALRWNKDEALRLALWVTAHAEALPVPLLASDITELSYDELVKALTPVWGWKMGTEKSKEARSHLWVPAALGDFKDQVQARDVVMFLAEAAKLSIPQTTWDDRVLVPGAMRKALLACSTNKIDSIRQENQEVGALLDRLRKVRRPVTVPFGLDEVGISAEEADFLVESGVFVRGSDGRYWVAEIYRHGLGFGSERRAKVLWRPRQ